MQYYVMQDNQQRGPFTLEQLASYPIPAGVLIWRQGLTGWLPPQQIPELAARLSATTVPAMPIPPPLPGSPLRQPAPRDTSNFDIRLIAVRQRRLIRGMGIGLLLYIFGMPALTAVCNVLGNAAQLSPEGTMVLGYIFAVPIALVCCGIQAWLAYALAEALQKSQPWIWGLGSCFSCVGLAVLFVLNQQATTLLTRSGVTVGFLGANIPE